MSPQTSYIFTVSKFNSKAVLFKCWIKNCTLGALQMKMTATCGIQKFRWREKIKHLSKWGVVNTGRPLHVKYWGVATSATPAALTPMPLTSSILWPLGERPIYLKPKAAMPNSCFLRPNIMKSDCTNITLCDYSAPVGEHSIVMSVCLSVCPRSPELRRTDDLRHFMRVIWPWLVLFLVVRIRYYTRCYFNVRSKADTSRLNLPHGYVGLHQVCGWHHICT